MTPKIVLHSRIAKIVKPSSLAYHWDTPRPTQAQLRRADNFFLSHPPLMLHSKDKFRTIQQSTLPEVAFLGRSNIGKSSLLNGLLRSGVCHISKKPGRTKTMNFIAVGGPDETGNAGRMLLLDMPGYGKGSREEWGEEVMKYLLGRRQLRRAFVLIDPVYGLKDSDEILLQSLRENAIPHQVLLPKVDRVLLHGAKKIPEKTLQKNVHNLSGIMEKLRARIQPGISDGPEALGEIISCSAEPGTARERKLGLDQVRWAILAAAGLGEEKRKLSPSEIGLGEEKQRLSSLEIDLDEEKRILSPLETVDEDEEPIFERAAVNTTRMND